MRQKMGRPVEFTESVRETFCSLVGVGLSRRQAAEYLGVSPSTPLRCAQRDDAFAEQLCNAEMRCEFELMDRMRRQCERSWRACVWLLERIHPERYGKGKSNESSGPTVDQLFASFVALVDRTVAESDVREQLIEGLDGLMREDQREPDGEPADHPQMKVSGAAPVPSRSGKVEMRPVEPSVSGSAKRVARKPASQAPMISPLPRDLLNSLGLRDSANALAPDFCNASPIAHERRSLASVCG